MLLRGMIWLWLMKYLRLYFRFRASTRGFYGFIGVIRLHFQPQSSLPHNSYLDFYVTVASASKAVSVIRVDGLEGIGISVKSNEIKLLWEYN